jgi:hypothetical protein
LSYYFGKIPEGKIYKAVFRDNNMIGIYHNGKRQLNGTM